VATLFTWGVTALGAASVFMVKRFNQKFLDSVLGFAVMMILDAT
jgi:ZIP family zinc transporter